MPRRPTAQPSWRWATPRPWGVVATVGHYSGMVDQAGFERLHYTGTLNGGMSGGPAINTRGVLVGVNANNRRGAEQMGFLVPAARVRQLLERANSPRRDGASASADEVTRQLTHFHHDLLKSAEDSMPSHRYGPYAAPDFAPARLNCRAIGNAVADDEDAPRRPAFVQGRDCRVTSAVELEDGLVAGYLEYSHRYLRAGSLNGWRFPRAGGLAAPRPAHHEQRQGDGQAALLEPGYTGRARIKCCPCI
jgi:serine protease Do